MDDQQDVTSDESRASNFHMLRLHVAISPALNLTFKNSSSSDVSTSSSCASSATCWDEICVGAGLALRGFLVSKAFKEKLDCLNGSPVSECGYIN